MTPHVTIVGSGIAAAAATIEALAQGAEVTVVQGRPGATAFSSGAWDIAFEPTPQLSWQEIPSPAQGFKEMIRRHPNHPYTLIHSNGSVADPLLLLANTFERIANQLSFPLRGSTGQPFLAITPLGTVKVTAYTDRSHHAGNLLEMREAKLLVVGFKGVPFSASLVANVLTQLHAKQRFPFCAEIRWIELASHSPVSSPIDFAARMDDEKAIEIFLETVIRETSRFHPTHIALPPVIGIEQTSHIFSRLAETTSGHWFETLALPPSVPGLRLHRQLCRFFQNARITLKGGEAKEPRIEKRRVRSLKVGKEELAIDRLILATGKFLGGGIVDDEAGLTKLREALLNLPVTLPLPVTQPDFFSSQPLATAGVRVSRFLQPVDGQGRLLHENLWAAGSLLGGYDAATQGCGMGVAVSTGTLAGRMAATL